MLSSVLPNVYAAQMRGACRQIKRRWLHESLQRQGIMMPTMSPWMTEGTITRWKIKEGDAFAPGDVLLQIESDIAMIDVEAHSPGILGKILVPGGTTNVPVEQVIALVARDRFELAMLQSLSIPSPRTIPAPLMTTTTFPRYLDQFQHPFLSRRTPALLPPTPSLFEMQKMGYGHRMALGVPREAAPRLDSTKAEYRVEVPPCPSPRIQKQDRYQFSNNS